MKICVIISRKRMNTTVLLDTICGITLFYFLSFDIFTFFSYLLKFYKITTLKSVNFLHFDIPVQFCNNSWYDYMLHSNIYLPLK